MTDKMASFTCLQIILMIGMLITGSINTLSKKAQNDCMYVCLTVLCTCFLIETKGLSNTGIETLKTQVSLKVNSIQPLGSK